MTDTMATAMLLYVEDELITQENVATVLREAGFTVTVASRGAEALNLLDKAEEPFRGPARIGRPRMGHPMVKLANWNEPVANAALTNKPLRRSGFDGGRV